MAGQLQEIFNFKPQPHFYSTSVVAEQQLKWNFA